MFPQSGPLKGKKASTPQFAPANEAPQKPDALRVLFNKYGGELGFSNQEFESFREEISNPQYRQELFRYISPELDDDYTLDDFDFDLGMTPVTPDLPWDAKPEFKEGAPTLDLAKLQSVQDDKMREAGIGEVAIQTQQQKTQAPVVREKEERLDSFISGGPEYLADQEAAKNAPWYEQIGSSFQKGLQQIPANIAQAVTMANDAIYRTPGLGDLAIYIDSMAPDANVRNRAAMMKKFGVEKYTEAVLDDLKDEYAEIDKRFQDKIYEQGFDPNDLSTWTAQTFGNAVAQSLPQMLVDAGLTVVNPALGGISISANTAGQIWANSLQEESRRTGRSVSDLLESGDDEKLVAILAGTAIGASERFALSSLLRGFKKGALLTNSPESFVRALATSAAKEGGTESLQEAVQIGAQGFSEASDGNKIDNAARKLRDGLGQIAFAGAVGSVIGGGATSVSSAINRRTSNTTENANQEGVIPQDRPGEYPGTAEVQQGQQENRDNQAQPVPEAEAAPSGGDSAGQSQAEQAVEPVPVEPAKPYTPKAEEKFGAEKATEVAAIASSIPGLDPAYRVSDTDIASLERSGEDVFKERLAARAAFTEDQLTRRLQEAEGFAAADRITRTGVYSDPADAPRVPDMTYEQAVNEVPDLRQVGPVANPTPEQVYSAKMRALFKRAEGGYWSDKADILSQYRELERQNPRTQEVRREQLVEAMRKGPVALKEYLRPILDRSKEGGPVKGSISLKRALSLVGNLSDMSKTESGMGRAADMVERVLSDGAYAEALDNALTERSKIAADKELPSNIKALIGSLKRVAVRELDTDALVQYSEAAKALRNTSAARAIVNMPRISEIISGLQVQSEAKKQVRLAERLSRGLSTGFSPGAVEAGYDPSSFDNVEAEFSEESLGEGAVNPPDTPKMGRIKQAVIEARGELRSYAEGAELDARQKSQIDALLGVDLSRVSNLDAKRLYYTMANIIANNDFTGYGARAEAIFNAQKRAKDVAKAVKQGRLLEAVSGAPKRIEDGVDKTFKSPAIVRLFNEYRQSISDRTEGLYRITFGLARADVGARMAQLADLVSTTTQQRESLRKAFLGDWDRAFSKFNYEYHTANKDYNALTRKMSSESKTKAYMAAILLRRRMGQSVEQGIQEMKSNLDQSLYNTIAQESAGRLKPGIRDQVKLAKKNKELYDTYFSWANTEADILQSLDPKEVALIDHMRTFFEEKKDALFTNDRELAGKEVEAEENYVPLKTRAVSDPSPYSTSDLENSPDMGAYRSSRKVSEEGAGALNTRKGIGSKRTYELNPDIVFSSAAEDILYDIHTRKARIEKQALLQDPEFEAAVGKENAQLLGRMALAQHVSAVGGTGAYANDLARVVGGIINSQIPVVLSSLRQPLQQYIPAITQYATRWSDGGYNALKHLNWFADTEYRKRLLALLNERGSATPNRYDSSLADTISYNNAAQLALRESGTSLNALAGNLQRAQRGYAEAVGKWVIARPDAAAAIPGFLAGYENSLRKQGLIPADVEFSVDKHLDNYAENGITEEQMRDAVQSADAFVGSVQGRSRPQDVPSGFVLDSDGRIIRDTLMRQLYLLSSFAANTATEVKIARRMLEHGDASMRAEAMQRLAGIGVQIASTAIVAELIVQMTGWLRERLMPKPTMSEREKEADQMQEENARNQRVLRGLLIALSNTTLGSTSLGSSLVRWATDSLFETFGPKGPDGEPLHTKGQVIARPGSIELLNLSTTITDLASGITEVAPDALLTSKYANSPELRAGVIATGVFVPVLSLAGIGSTSLNEASRDFNRRMRAVASGSALSGEQGLIREEQQRRAFYEKEDQRIMREWSVKTFEEEVKPLLDTLSNMKAGEQKQQAMLSVANAFEMPDGDPVNEAAIVSNTSLFSNTVYGKTLAMLMERAESIPAAERYPFYLDAHRRARKLAAEVKQLAKDSSVLPMRVSSYEAKALSELSPEKKQVRIADIARSKNIRTTDLLISLYLAGAISNSEYRSFVALGSIDDGLFPRPSSRPETPAP